MALSTRHSRSDDPENNDPSAIGYPATLPIEVALHAAPIRVLCEEYGLTREDWEQLRVNPLFVADVRAVAETLRRDGMSFKLKARLQSEELLKKTWEMIHAPLADIPAAVRADLIKFTVRVAGLDAGLEKANAATGNNLSIQINLG